MNKLKQTKQTKEQFNEYILKAIYTDEYKAYNVDVEPVTDKERLQFLYNTFNKEFKYRIKQIGQYNAFKEWLQGLPSVFNIDFMNHEILTLTEKIYNCTLTEKEQEKILNNWFNFITVKTFKLFEKYSINTDVRK